jgi:hypothetical protein
MFSFARIFLALLWLNLAIIAITALIRPWIERYVPELYRYRHVFVRYQILILIAGWSIYSFIQIIQK